ncbi:MAG TPA: inositol monophosphatase [Tessaracoccus flavescens]|uniref:Inositol monophosphatase n=1 Tax=Tessaracoccus flavescens TaxID=399497 RepID=A0A921ENL3_9ACTN|nr:inositol monophosphatase [Tessaracoccus flavescens]
MDTDGILRLIHETAAEVITPRFRSLAESDIDSKRHKGDLVTVADTEAERVLTRRLKEVYPEALVLGEESVFEDPSLLKGVANADHAFIIDPIDGTGNFVRGDERYGSMLCELRGGVTTRGWIYQPQTERSYVAERGAGVRLNGEPIIRERPQRLPLGAASRKRVVGYSVDGRLSPIVPSSYACAFDYPNVLHGVIDFIAYNSLHPWDHLPGSLMVTELGGVSRTFDGLAYTVQTRSKGLLVAGDTVSWMAAQKYWPVED